MILSLRGTNGSGKSTAVRALLAQGNARPIYGVLGPKQPEAYELVLRACKHKVYVLGPYITGTGGCDRIQPYDTIIDLINKYAERGHVVFEGVIVSSNYGRIGTILEEFGQQAVMMVLTTSLEECIKAVNGRRTTGKELNPRQLTQKFKAVQSIAKRVKDEGKMRLVMVSREDACSQIMILLRAGS